MTESNPYDPPAISVVPPPEHRPVGFLERTSVYIKLIHLTGEWIPAVSLLLFCAFAFCVALGVICFNTELDEMLEHKLKTWLK